MHLIYVYITKEQINTGIEILKEGPCTYFIVAEKLYPQI